MSRIPKFFASIALATGLASALAQAAEPNETFATATILAPGVLTVSDQLVQPPDTILGIRNFLGAIVDFDDDSSPVGNGHASGLVGVPTQQQNGTISFVISGYGDDDFVGNHGESGALDVYVQTYDSFGDPANLFTSSATLAPGSVEEYSFVDEDAVLGSYDVYIDNLGYFSVNADIDYFTFTGLTPGAPFTAQTFDPQNIAIDTQLGWFGDSGFLISEDDDGGSDGLSLLTGTVPPNGKVTLAVTGTNDDAYLGDHFASGPYELKLTLGGEDYAADFNNDGKVNAADLAAWKLAFGQGAGADANGDLKTDGADFLIWQRQFGSGVPATAAVATIPEPASAALLAIAFGGSAMSIVRQPPGRRVRHPAA
ncbi:dockerin type I domain-containing protein [Lacipirellula sp.]|uniref:dockerin type I domain-containing protein n=1 Tax=Lacipirellula sp. TaxID=2691419 RepID=UPI003D0FE5CF